MYEDVSYYTTTVEPQATVNRQPSVRRKRKNSLLEPTREGGQANVSSIDVGKTLAEEETASPLLSGPPRATLSRTAQSFADFHYAVEAVLGPPIERENAGAKTGEDHGIRNELDFEDWYDQLEDGLLEASHDKYKDYQRQLEFSESYLSSLSATTSSTLDLLGTLSDAFTAVGAQTAAFQSQCENLISEQQRLSHLADELGQNLKYYSFLEPITRRLNAPGAGSFVRGKEFSDMLARLDECLEYMAAHPNQREAATYRSRYRLLLTRGLTLIRVHFVGSLREIAQDVSRRIADKQLNDTTMSTLLYAKFRIGASELKEVAQEIKARAVVPADAEPGAEAEYQSLMNELYTSYSVTRGKLVLPLVWKKIGEISMAPSTSRDLVAFARSSMGYVRNVCSDEHELWREWFEGDDGLYGFLEAVCEPLYDRLRPKIIHENQLLKLCELCTLIQTRYMQEPDDDLAIVEPHELEFSILIRSALEDAQTRLVFRTQAILRDEIENYKPKPEDLNLPANGQKASVGGAKRKGPVTSGRKGSVVVEPLKPKDPVIVDNDDEFTNGVYGFDIESAYQGWYPTLRKAIWLLSRIYRLVNSTVFDDLAHQIVHQTTLSLHTASRTLLALRGPDARLDAHLFLLKYLLILKQQIVAFDIEYVTPDVSFDFSGMTHTFYELRERGGLFDPRNLWRLVGGGSGGPASLLPRVVENMLDAKAELDARLRSVINDLTSEQAERMTGPALSPSTKKTGVDAQATMNMLQRSVESGLPALRHRLAAYLEDARTRETLVTAVQEIIMQNYESFWDARNGGAGKKGKAKGKGREDELWDPETFAEWVGDAFRVGNVDGGGEGSWGASREGSP